MFLHVTGWCRLKVKETTLNHTWLPHGRRVARQQLNSESLGVAKASRRHWHFFSNSLKIKTHYIQEIECYLVELLANRQFYLKYEGVNDKYDTAGKISRGSRQIYGYREEGCVYYQFIHSSRQDLWKIFCLFPSQNKYQLRLEVCITMYLYIPLSAILFKPGEVCLHELTFEVYKFSRKHVIWNKKLQ